VTNERSQYEQACLDALREDLAFNPDSLRRRGISVLDIRLEGSHPDTKLVIQFTDARTGKEYVWDIAIWKDNPYAPEGVRIDPEMMAAFIVTNLQEPKG
jgi:hypothetical protein